MELPSDADALFAGPPMRLVFAAALGLDRSLLHLFDIGSAAARGLPEDETRNEPTREPQGRDEVDHVTSPEQDSDRQESSDDRDDRADPRSAVSGIGNRKERHADGDRAQPARAVEKVVGERRDD